MSIIFFSAFSIFIFLYSKYKYNLKGFLMNRCVYLLHAYKCKTILSLFKHTKKNKFNFFTSSLYLIMIWDMKRFFLLLFLFKEEITPRVARGKIFCLHFSFLVCFLFDFSVWIYLLYFFCVIILSQAQCEQGEYANKIFIFKAELINLNGIFFQWLCYCLCFFINNWSSNWKKSSVWWC